MDNLNLDALNKTSNKRLELPRTVQNSHESRHYRRGGSRSGDFEVGPLSEEVDQRKHDLTSEKALQIESVHETQVTGHRIRLNESNRSLSGSPNEWSEQRVSRNAPNDLSDLRSVQSELRISSKEQLGKFIGSNGFFHPLLQNSLLRRDTRARHSNQTTRVATNCGGGAFAKSKN